MRKAIYGIPLAVATLLSVGPAAAFTNDDFNDGTLGPQWSFVDSTPAGATHVEQDGHIIIDAPEGSDHYFWLDSHAFIQQDAPTGTNWEIVTKLDDFNPTVAGQQRRFTRAGIRLWQDNDHFITLSVLSSGDGLGINSQNLWQFDSDIEGSRDWRLMGAIDLFGYPPLPNASIWLKLRSTPRGYQGFMSRDGINWLEALSIVKNHDSPDGLLQNPKVRLFHAGGFYHGPGNQASTPAKFDFIESTTVTDPDPPYADDEFNGTTLAPQWSFFRGIGEGHLGFHEGALVLSPGINSNLWFDREQAMHVYQNAPDLPAYHLTTKVGPTNMTQIPYELWGSYGIWLWKDQSHWALISNSRGDENVGGVWTPNNRIEAAVKWSRQMPGGLEKGHFVDRSVSFLQATPNTAPEYLRIVNDGTEIELQYSYDNITYTPFEFMVDGVPKTKFNIGQDDLQVRLFTKRVFNDGEDGDGQFNPPMDAHFDWLRVTPIAPSTVSDWTLY